MLLVVLYSCSYSTLSDANALLGSVRSPMSHVPCPMEDAPTLLFLFMLHRLVCRRLGARIAFHTSVVHEQSQGTDG